jgi:hypothetical protein
MIKRPLLESPQQVSGASSVATNVGGGHLAVVKNANPTLGKPIQPTTMSKPFFALVVCAILVMVPSAHSTADSEVRPNLTFTVTAPILPHFRVIATELVSLILPQVQSQFLRLADLIDSSIDRFHSSQRAADLDDVDDAINSLEQRSNSPAVTSLTLRSYLAQREQILYVVAGLTHFDPFINASFCSQLSSLLTGCSGHQCSSSGESIPVIVMFGVDTRAF